MKGRGIGDSGAGTDKKSSRFPFHFSPLSPYASPNHAQFPPPLTNTLRPVGVPDVRRSGYHEYRLTRLRWRTDSRYVANRLKEMKRLPAPVAMCLETNETN